MRTKILLAVIALLLAGALCAAFPADADQPTGEIATAYPAPVYAAYPPPVVVTDAPEEPEPTAAPDAEIEWHYCTPGEWGC